MKKVVWVTGIVLATAVVDANASWRQWWNWHGWQDWGSNASSTNGNTNGSTDTSNGVPDPVPTTPTNQSPTISGSPIGSVTTGSGFSFTPSADDADGDALTFTVANQPAWASFDSATGTLSGTPSAAEAGTYDGITISVSDGSHTASLAPFSIAVNQISTGVVTLSWTAPTENTDGSALTDMAGYRIYEGSDASSLSRLTEIATTGLSTYAITDVAPGTHFYAVTAYTSAGVESGWSNEVSKTVN